MKLLLNVSHVILQRFTIIASSCSCYGVSSKDFCLLGSSSSSSSLDPSGSKGSTGWSGGFCFFVSRLRRIINRAHLLRQVLGLLFLGLLSTVRHLGFGFGHLLGLLLFSPSTMSNEERRKQAVYIYPSDSHEHSYHCTQDHTSAPRAIALTHVQSSDHLINCAILLHYFTTLAFIVQQAYIDARYIARFNAFALHNGRFRSCEFHTNIFFHMRLFRQEFTIQTKIYRSHEYFVASARAPIVKGP